MEQVSKCCGAKIVMCSVGWKCTNCENWAKQKSEITELADPTPPTSSVEDGVDVAIGRLSRYYRSFLNEDDMVDQNEIDDLHDNVNQAVTRVISQAEARGEKRGELRGMLREATYHNIEWRVQELQKEITASKEDNATHD